MVKFINITESPLVLFEDKYKKAVDIGQRNADALAISSFNTKEDEVDSRFVNLKFVHGKKFIFFTNYNSPKALAFSMHKQISALMYWPEINTQVRIKANIKKTSRNFNKKYFSERSKDKNALAISSNQSKRVNSFNDVKAKYFKTREFNNLDNCPDYWGGYQLDPYEIEFWEGSEFRLNERNLYIKNKTTWNHFILEP